MLKIFLFFCFILISILYAKEGVDEKIGTFFSRSEHTNNWAVLVCSSRYWFNYRHVANVLSLYHSVKRLGIPDRFIFIF